MIETAKRCVRHAMEADGYTPYPDVKLLVCATDGGDQLHILATDDAEPRVSYRGQDGKWRGPEQCEEFRLEGQRFLVWL